MKINQFSEASNQVPRPGDTIRTNKMQMDGKVESINGNEVLFRISDGRLMKTSINNVTVVEKLADEDDEIMEAINRRGFLKGVGAAAASVAMPGGIIGKLIKSAGVGAVEANQFIPLLMAAIAIGNEKLSDSWNAEGEEVTVDLDPKNLTDEQKKMISNLLGQGGTFSPWSRDGDFEYLKSDKGVPFFLMTDGAYELHLVFPVRGGGYGDINLYYDSNSYGNKPYSIEEYSGISDENADLISELLDTENDEGDGEFFKKVVDIGLFGNSGVKSKEIAKDISSQAIKTAAGTALRGQLGAAAMAVGSQFKNILKQVIGSILATPADNSEPANQQPDAPAALPAPSLDTEDIIFQMKQELDRELEPVEINVIDQMVNQMNKKEELNEISNEVLARYKTAAGRSAAVADKAGDFAKGNKRFSGMIQATKKQFANDAKKAISEITIPGVEDNFTVDDIKRLEQIHDLPTIKAQAKELVKGKAARRMKPEKISWFYNAIDGKMNRMAVIKLMYDLLLAGEGNSVVGTRNSMRQNTYRDRFGESKKEGHIMSMDEINDYLGHWGKQTGHGGWKVIDVDPIGETDFEVSLHDNEGTQLNFIIRPVDFIETQLKRFQIDGMDVRDLQSGKTMYWDTGTSLPEPYNHIYDTIDEYFWTTRELQARLGKIVDYYVEGGEHGRNPDMMAGLDKRPSGWTSHGANDVIGAKKSVDNLIKNTKPKNTKPKTEGTMGGINRSRPAQDVSYEKVLDRNPKTAHSEVIGEDNIIDEVMNKWNKEQVNELSNDIMQKYAAKAGSEKSVRTRPLIKLAKSAKGVATANQKIKTRTGNMQDPDIGKGTYESRLAEFVELLEVDKDKFKSEFADLLGRQEQEKKAAEPKRKVIPIDYHGWTIKYRKANKPTDVVDWEIYNHKMEKKHSGKALSDEEAVSNAEEWIKSGGGTKKKATKKVTIDFNEQFRDEFSPNGETFYANIISDEGGPALLMSNEPQKPLKKSWPRSDTHLPMIPMSATESNDAELQPNGRYLLGPRTDMGDGLLLFPLTLHSICQSSTDTYKLGKQGLTVATERGSEVDVSEAITPWGGYSKDDPKANALSKAPKTSMQGSGDVIFSDMVQDTINKHGVKWAFDYYVKKHGLPPRQFQLFAGLNTTPSVRR